MGRTRKDDVFVLGDELIATETTALRNADRAAPGDDQEPEGPPLPGLGHRIHPGAARVLAVLGLGAAAAATLGVLELTSGSSKQLQLAETSPRSALVFPPAPSAANPPGPTGSPSPQPEPSHGDFAAARRRSQIAKREHEREPMPTEAPESSPAQISTPPAAPLTAAPALVPPSPPPPAGGGGPEGTEQFGFER